MTEATALDDLTRSYLDLRWHLDPVAASSAGLAQYDGRLGTFTGEVVQTHRAALRAMMLAVEAFEIDDLEGEIDRTALLNEIRFTVQRFAAERPHERNPGFWLSHLLEGLYLPLALRDRPRDARARSAHARLRAVPTFLDDARATLSRCPRVLVELGVEIVRGGDLLIAEIGTHLRPDDADTFDADRQAARDALSAFGDHLSASIGDSPEDGFAVGVDAFNFRLQFQHALPQTASELARYGEGLARRVEAELEAMAAEIAPRTCWLDLADRLREDHPGSDELVRTYAVEMARARAFVEERELAPVPEGVLDVVPTPPFLVPLVPFAAYQPPGPFSADRTGWFYVSRPPGTDLDALRDHCVYEIPSTALHEGFPGHHLQFLNAQAQPSLVRRVLGTPVTVEGWALYCEEMMGEEGFYRSLEERFFQRVALLWRALRIVLDVGLHTGRLTFVDAVKVLIDRLHFARSHAEAEVRRYCAEPGYQLAYAVGRRELAALRDDYRRAAGDGFTLRGFHDAILAYGGLPPSLMRWGMRLSRG